LIFLVPRIIISIPTRSFALSIRAPSRQNKTDTARAVSARIDSFTAEREEGAEKLAPLNV
jgi:hypothetical protein